MQQHTFQSHAPFVESCAALSWCMGVGYALQLATSYINPCMLPQVHTIGKGTSTPADEGQILFQQNSNYRCGKLLGTYRLDDIRQPLHLFCIRHHM